MASPRSEKFSKVLFGIFLVSAILAPGLEVVVFLHDRYVVWQDFDCLNQKLIAQGKTLEDLDAWEDQAQCNLESRKPFGRRSTRAWFCGLPQLWLSMEPDHVRLSILLGLPFVLWSTWLSFKTRKKSRRIQPILLGFLWMVMLSGLAAVFFGFDQKPWLDQATAQANQSVFYFWWWLVRISSFVYLFALMLFSTVFIIDKIKPGR